MQVIEKQPINASDDGTYRSGTAARLAGIPVDTLRVWERRYAVVGPRLSSGRQRLYSAADIKRLSLIKRLVDMGHPIGTLAALGEEALERMRAAAMPLQQSQPAHAVAQDLDLRVALVGPLLRRDRIEPALIEGTLRIVADCPDPQLAVSALAASHADAVVIEFQTLGDNDLALVASIRAACKATCALVLYRHAPSSLIRRLRRAGNVVARTSSDPLEIETLCLGALRQAGLGSSPVQHPQQVPEPRPQRFDMHTLAELVVTLPRLECECPQNIIDIVMNLGSFERYSAQCASRNPADAALHADMQRAAGLALAIMESALERLAAAEGIALVASAESP